MKKHQPAHTATEADRLIRMAEANFVKGNFHAARMLAHKIRAMKESSAHNREQASNILRWTGVDPLALSVGLVSLIFSGVVAYISAY